LEEWAIIILKWAFTHAYNADEECETQWNRASKMRHIFTISNIEFTIDVGCGPEMAATASLNTKAKMVQ
jgi:hypothetical protein